ncbi:MAG: TOBE domain-containing protein, partial [Caldimonas sp.]
VWALIKAPWVNVASKAPPPSAARNSFEGTISALERGSSRTRLGVTTDSGRTLSAALPDALVVARGLQRGARAWASFARDSVILATFD